MKNITVGELKKALEDVPDDLEVELSSDTGVDQGDSEVIIHQARRIKYTSIISGIKRDYFAIFADYNDDLEEE